MSGSGTPLVYWPSVAGAAVGGAALCLAGRWRPGPWRWTVARVLGALLAAEVVSWEVNYLVHGTWSVRSSLPFDLCDITALLAAAACWTRRPALVELTYFWGLAGTLQAVLTPDIGAPFPQLEFINYDVEHLGIVVAAVFLVAGCGLVPRPGAVGRVFVTTLLYTAFVGAVDVVTGGDYMYLRSPPGTWSLLNVMGPWPWYIASGAALALALFLILDAPLRPGRRQALAGARPSGAAAVSPTADAAS
jgi:hypothetical integral membrane protein (TIGR02206 family)